MTPPEDHHASAPIRIEIPQGYHQPLNTEQLFRELGDIKAGVADVHTQLKISNGRIRKSEIKIAVMWLLWSLAGTAAVAILSNLSAIIQAFAHVSPLGLG